MSAVTLLQSLAPSTAERVARDYLTSLLSGKPADNEHPAAADLRSLPLDERTFEAIAQGLSSRGAKFDSGFPQMTRELLSNIVDPALTVVSRAYPEPGHRLFTAMLPARDYRAQSYITGLDGVTVDPVSELSEFPVTLGFTGNAETATLKRVGRIVSIPRQTIVDDARCGFFNDVGRALVAACYRAEATDVYAKLEANPTLGDGNAWFDASNTASGASSIAALWAGIEAFYGQAYDSGEFVSASPAHLVVPVDWVVTANDLPADAANLTVTRSPHLANAYLFASPSACPAVGLATLSERPVLESNPRPPANVDVGMQVKVSHDFAAVPLSRVGVVRMTVTS